MTLQNYLAEIKPMSEVKANEIASYFEKELVPKHSLLIQEGKTSKYSYFLQEGIVQCFTNDINGDEVTTQLYSSPHFINDYLSFFKQQPSEENYKTLTACELWKISLKDVEYCFHHIPEFREWGRMHLTLNYVELHKHMLSYHKKTAQERYVELLEKYPEIIQQVPLKIIASYLGSTKYSLSRIRKEIITPN